MSQIQSFPIFLPNRGQVLDKPAELLPQYFSPYSRNMELYDQLLQGRLGLTKFDTAVLSGRIMEIAQFKKFNGTRYLLFCTPKDIYSWDSGDARFDILTPVYTTGTIEVKTGELTKVYGTGTLWSANLKAGDFIKIGSGSVHTGSTWYTIQTVDSNTLLTLTSSAPITAASTAYVARQTFAGGDTDFWCAEQFMDAALGEVMLFTNGQDTPVRWTGTGQVAALTGLPDTMKAKFVAVYKDRVQWINTIEGGSRQPQRVRWSDVANCQSYQAIDFHDFVDENSSCVGAKIFSGYLIIFKEDTAYVGRWIGGTYIFDFDRADMCRGTFAAKSIIGKPDGIYYFGSDGKFRRFTPTSDDAIGQENFNETRDFDPNFLQYIVGHDVKRKNQIRWHCPYGSTAKNNYTFVYDYKEGTVEPWEYAHPEACCSIGEFVRDSDLYVDDSVWGEYYLDEQEGYWDDASVLSSAPVIIYGGYDGIVRISDVGLNDDGYAYMRRFRMTKLNFKMPDQVKRLWRQQWWLQASSGGSVTVKLRKDDNEGFEAQTKTILLDNSGKNRLKAMITWDKQAQNFQPEIESSGHFALEGVINYVSRKGLSI